MHAFLALPPVRAKASQIETTEGLAYVLLATARAKRTEAFIIMRARGELGGGVNMQVEAFITIGAVEGAGVMIAVGHAAKIVFVQVLAPISLLAQTSQPMLAYHIIE